MQKIPYFSGRTKLNHFNSTMSVESLVGGAHADTRRLSLCRARLCVYAGWCT